MNGVSTTGPGERQKTRAHPQFGLFVLVEGIDPANDLFEMRLEVSAEGEYWAPVDSAVPSVSDLFFVDDGDLAETDTTGTYVFYTSHHNIPVEYVRPNVISNDAGATVTVDVFLSGWTQRGASFDYLNPDE